MTLSPQHTPTPNTTILTLDVNVKYEQLKREALETNCIDFCDLPPLHCGECGKHATFGGCQMFVVNKYSVDEMCTCNCR